MTLRRGFTLKQWTVLPLEGCLERDGDVRRVQPKSMDVLLCLAEAGGEVVERDQLLRQVWGDRWVSDEPLTRCIGELRRALGDQRGEPEYILTVPKRGYRLLPKPVPVRNAEDDVHMPDHPRLTRQQKARRRITLNKIAAGLAILVLAALVQIGVERMLEDTDGPATSTPDTAALDARSIAVLPFTDMSVAGDQEYMSDGIAEEVLNLLAKVHGLRVISRSSSFSLKGQAIDIPTVAGRFNVAHVLEGSVRTSGNRIRVTAQLIDARSDAHVWSETFDRELTDVFAIQEEIAGAVVDKLELTLSPGTAVPRETDPEAYALFLQARYLHEQPAGDSFRRAFDYYEAALEVDDSYVPAWVWLAALYDDTINSSELPREEVLRRMFEAIDRALEIDPEDPLALGMSSVLLETWTDDLETASARMRRALALDPSNSILLRWAVIAMNGFGQHKEAVAVAEYLFARDPVGNISRINLASTYLMAGRFDDAVRICEIQVATVSETGPCRARLIIAYLYVGNAAAAKQQLDFASGSRVYTRLAPMVFYSLGQTQEFDAALANLHRAFEDGDATMAYWIARTYTFTNDADRAFAWLERARKEGVLSLTHSSAYYTHLHGDPRWPELLEALGRRPEDTAGLTIEVRLPD